MYEPIVDISLTELRNLYRDVKTLKHETIIANIEK